MREDEIDALESYWPFWARPSQLEPPGHWRTWLVLAGRGFGKTRCGAEWIRLQVDRGRKRIALVSPTAAAARDIVVEGESGILSVCHDPMRPTYEPSKRRLTWPNGAMATCYSAEEPETLRGPQHDCAWFDELAAAKYPREAIDMLRFGLRLGGDPRLLVTTTPKPLAIIRELLKDPATVVTRGTTMDNRVNLAPQFMTEIINKYSGTRLGRQELYGEVLDDVPGALWTRAMVDDARVAEAPDLQRVVVAIDPAATSLESSDETGIVVVGLGVDGHAYVLADLSCRLTPEGWARRAVNAYVNFQADRIVAEVNNGGEMVQAVVRTVDPNVAFTAVHASRGKQMRAEPIAALYEQRRVHHVGEFADMEDQLCSWAPGNYDGSPDRMDALVWAVTELMLNDGGPVYVHYEERVEISRY